MSPDANLTEPIPAKHEAWRIRYKYRGAVNPSGLDQNLSLEEVDTPQPDQLLPGQVLVRMHAAALNYRDLAIGTADPRYPIGGHVDGLIPLCDGSGVVAGLAPSSSPRWKLGDRVFIIANTTWRKGQTQADLDTSTILGAGSAHGLLQRYFVADEDALVPTPAHISLEEVASVTGAYASAWNALFGGPRPLEKGDVIVTQGAGGVSIAALQIATAFGADVIALSTSQGKLETLKRLGAKHALLYSGKSDSDWSEEVKSLTGGRGADHVVDVVGASTIRESIRAVRQGGLVSVLGFLSPSEAHDLVPEIVKGAKIVRGLLYASVPMIWEVSSFLEEKGIRPVIMKTFDWHDTKEAYKAALDGSLVGKIVIKVN